MGIGGGHSCVCNPCVKKVRATITPAPSAANSLPLDVRLSPSLDAPCDEGDSAARARIEARGGELLVASAYFLTAESLGPRGRQIVGDEVDGDVGASEGLDDGPDRLPYGVPRRLSATPPERAPTMRHVGPDMAATTAHRPW